MARYQSIDFAGLISIHFNLSLDQFIVAAVAAFGGGNNEVG